MVYSNIKKSGLFSFGDINGFLGLIADNMANLSLATVLLMIFDFPKEVIFSHIYPGIVFCIFLGNLLMSLIGIRMARKTGRTDITAMPYGLDAPTTISMPLIVVGPVFAAFKAGGMDPHTAAISAWQVGMAAAAVIGIFKIIGFTIAQRIANTIPLAGLLGSLAGIGAMIGMFAIKEIFSIPLVGIISLGFVLYVLIANIPFPFRLPGVLVGVIVCTAIYHIFGPLNMLHTHYVAPVMSLTPSFPLPSLGFITGMTHILPFLPVIIPFGILVTIGDINVTVSANEAGDPYVPKNILLTDGINTLIGAIFGSITQTTAYAGQPAYKRMGCKMGYTLYSAIFMGICGLLGVVSFFVQLIPVAIFAPILIFVALEIIAQGYTAVPHKHAVASAFAMFPSIMRFISILLAGGSIITFQNLTGLVSKIGETYPETLIYFVLANGFILTGMLWGGLVAELIDRKFRNSGMYLLALALFTFFGIVHSTDINGIMYLPWTLQDSQRFMVYDISLVYLILSLVMFVLSAESVRKYLWKE